MVGYRRNHFDDVMNVADFLAQQRHLLGVISHLPRQIGMRVRRVFQRQFHPAHGLKRRFGRAANARRPGGNRLRLPQRLLDGRRNLIRFADVLPERIGLRFRAFHHGRRRLGKLRAERLALFKRGGGNAAHLRHALFGGGLP